MNVDPQGAQRAFDQILHAALRIGYRGGLGFLVTAGQYKEDYTIENSPLFVSSAYAPNIPKELRSLKVSVLLTKRLTVSLVRRLRKTTYPTM